MAERQTARQSAREGPPRLTPAQVRRCFDGTIGDLSALGRSVAALVADLELDLRLAARPPTPQAPQSPNRSHRVTTTRLRRPGFRPPG